MGAPLECGTFAGARCRDAELLHWQMLSFAKVICEGDLTIYSFSFLTFPNCPCLRLFASWFVLVTGRFGTKNVMLIENYGVYRRKTATETGRMVVKA
jgi:hypothetical protein